MTTLATPKGGLEDIVATSSAICYLDGDRGVLAYCGYDIHDLAERATFEEVCYLLWHRRLPSRAELGDLQSQLAASRDLPEGVLRAIRLVPAGDGMDALRTLASTLAHYDPEAGDHTPQGNYRRAVRLTAHRCPGCPAFLTVLDGTGSHICTLVQPSSARSQRRSRVRPSADSRTSPSGVSARGRSSRLCRPKHSRNSHVVPYRMGRPGASLRPRSSMSRRDASV